MNTRNLCHNIEILKDVAKCCSTIEAIKIVEAFKKGEDKINGQISALCEISEILGTTIHSLSIEKLTREKVKQILENKATIPQKYLMPYEQRSSLAGIRNICDYLHGLLGVSRTNKFFRSIDVSKDSLLSRKDRFVSSRLPFDLLNELSAYQLSTEHFLEMGRNTAKIMPEGLKKSIEIEKSNKERIEKLVFEVIPKNYDNFYHYRIDNIKGDEAQIVISVDKDARTIFRDEIPFNVELGYYLQGAFEGVVEKSTNQKVEGTLLHFSKQKGATIQLLTRQNH